MSTKWIVGVIIVLGAILLLWRGGNSGSTPGAVVPTATTNQGQPQANAAPTNGMSPNTNTTDAGLAQDSAAIDTQMQGFASDSSNINASLTDTPVGQAF